MEHDIAGDAMSNKKWCRKDTRSLSREMRALGIEISPNSVATMLKDQNYSLRLNRKSITETYHAERNRQFEIIAETKKRFEDSGCPILSIDTKKKELVGNFRNPGKIWTRKNIDVLTHDFRSQAVAIASPYGLYEILLNRGTVIIGTSCDTSEFAVDCLDLWLNKFGWDTYPNMNSMLLLCDSGGSNGYRPRLWKYKLYNIICKPYGIKIHICHYPPGASKWNPIEHRLFSFISMEWAGHPLTSIERMIDYINGTTTKTGLEVTALLNSNAYKTGIKVDNTQFNQVKIKRNEILPDWNYTILPD